MIKEAYCSFEVAKLLKEKGFGIKEETRGYYPIKGDATGRLMFGAEYHHNTSQVQIAAPTHQMAMAWLREEHDIFIDISYDDLDFYWIVESIAADVPVQDRPKLLKNGTACHRTYEEAVETALKYCLENLI